MDRLKSGKLPRLPYQLMLVAVALSFTIPGGVLSSLGINYQTPGGSIIQKVHPATYLLAFSFFVCLVAGNSRVTILNWRHVNKRIGLYLFAVASFIAYAATFLDVGLANIVDTWLAPGLFVALIGAADNRQKSQVYLLVCTMMYANAAIGLYEFQAGYRVVPLTVGDYADTGGLIDTSNWSESRSTALLGLPLSATLSMSLFVVMNAALCIFRGVTLPRISGLGVGLISLPTFGGRFAIATTFFFITLMLASRLASFAMGRGVGAKGLLTFAAIALALPFVSVLLYGIGFLDPIIERIRDDNGSTSARWRALDLLHSSSWLDVLFGDISGTLIYRMIASGTIYGVEISWIALILQYGMLVVVFVLTSLWYLLRGIEKGQGAVIAWPIAAFLVASSSGVGLASKSLLLLHLVILVSTVPTASRTTASVSRPSMFFVDGRSIAPQPQAR